MVTWNVSEWLDIAARGIFAFDWRSDTHRYKLIAKPQSPIRLDELNHDQLPGLALSWS